MIRRGQTRPGREATLRIRPDVILRGLTELHLEFTL
jgi:hypothetical protein